MTMPFGPALEALLKDPLQGGKMMMMKGLQVCPRFFCCLSGNAVGVAKDPVAVLIVNPTRACTGANINADYSHSWSPTSTINAWSIDWGDGNVSNGAWPGAGNVNHPGGGYALPGIYTITLTVTDLLGATGEDSQRVEIIDCSDIALGVFAGCGASGVWYTGNCGSNWEERGGGVLEGVEVYDLKVHPFSLGLDKQVLWAATANGLYRSIDSGESWWAITLPEPESGVGEPTAASIVCSTVIENEAYVLAYTTVPSNRVWLCRTIDRGETWTYLGLTAPKYLFGVAFVSRGTVWQRTPGPNWLNRDRISEGSIAYWESNNPTIYKAHTKAAAALGGLWRWDPFAWTLIGANRECPLDMVVRANGDLAMIESGCCKLLSAPIGCTANPFVRIYGTNEVLKDTIALPVLANTTRYVYITEFDGELYVSRVATFFADFAILRYDALSSTWITEWAPGTNDLYANSFAEHEGRLYASIADGSLVATESKKLLVRSLIGGTWDWDTIEASGKIRRVREFDGKLYVLWGGGKIQRRMDTAYKDIITTSVPLGTPMDFTLYGGQWFLVTHDGGGGPTRFYRWDVGTSAWVEEKQDVNSADSGDYEFVPKHFAEEPGSDCTISSVGRTHLTSMSADGQYVYAVILDSNSNPVIVRAVYDLSEKVVAVHAPGAGSWGGVKADYTDIAMVWVFGDFGATSKVLVSNDWGDTLTDVTDGGWGAGEIVRPVLPSIYDGADVVAILNTALESWRSGDTGDTWVKTGDLAFACHCGERDWIEEQNLFVGRLAAGAAHLQFSPNRGAAWAERSGGITANAPIVALQVVS